ncbi:hypothetical protein BsWGS_19450 [Bradybaena similaris]
MAVNMPSISKIYDDLMAQADPLCENFPLMGSPVVFFSIIGLYLIIVWKGPTWMAPYKPLELKPLLVVYNILLVILALYISLGTLKYIVLGGGYPVLFYAVERTRTHENREFHAMIGWWFCMSKLIEFLDTVFFILRKKNSHINFLHVYHHATMAVFTWLGLKFLPGGSNIMYPLLNSMVHSLMYTYYGLSALGPRFHKYLWWKKYVTMIQIGQFVVYLLQDVINILYGNTLPKIFCYPAYAYTVSILILFVRFYLRAYSKNSVKKADHAVENGTHKNGAIATNGECKKSE